jgi:hypothetical protein
MSLFAYLCLILVIGVCAILITPGFVLGYVAPKDPDR